MMNRLKADKILDGGEVIKLRKSTSHVQPVATAGNHCVQVERGITRFTTKSVKTSMGFTSTTSVDFGGVSQSLEFSFGASKTATTGEEESLTINVNVWNPDSCKAPEKCTVYMATARITADIWKCTPDPLGTLCNGYVCTKYGSGSQDVKLVEVTNSCRQCEVDCRARHSPFRN